MGAAPAKAQTLNTGRLHGRVVDAAGNAVGNAVIALRDRLTRQVRTQVLDRGGQFTFQFLPPGNFDLTVEAFGFRPLRVEEVGVFGARTTSLTTVLSRSENPNDPAEVRRFKGAGYGGQATFSGELIQSVPDATRDLSWLARLSSYAADALETEGLPGYLTGLRTDGVAVGAAAIYGFGPVSPLALSGVRQAEFSTGADVELHGMAAPGLAVHMIDPSADLRTKAFADYSNGMSSSGELSAAAFSGFRGGALVTGPLVKDTSGFVFGAEVWRNQLPIAFAERITTAADRAQAAVSQRGAGEFALPETAAEDAISAFGRVNWRLGGRHELSISGAFTSLSEGEWLPPAGSDPGLNPIVAGKDGLISLGVLSQFSRSVGQELRLSWDRTVREYDIAGEGLRQSATLVTQSGLSVGRNPDLFGSFDASTLRLRETVHVWNGEHHLKVGGSVEFAAHKQTQLSAREATFWYTSEEQIGTQPGFSVQTNGIAEADFTLGRAGLYLQDEWALNDRLRILVGARWDLDLPPVDDLIIDEEFLELSGLRGDTALTRRGRISPRIEFEWLPASDGSWTLRGTAGIWNASLDPVLVGELLSNHGNVNVSRGFGAFGQWPQPTGQSSIRALSLAASAFQGARSKRAMLELSGQISPAIHLDLSGSYRYTDLLPVRSDINLLADAGTRDQYGRPIFGELRQVGGILAPVPESNRRFPQYDVVSGINVNGNSTYIGASANLRAKLSDVVSLQASYTFSDTKDNWFMARQTGRAAGISPLPEETWTDARSDFDVPHRAVVIAELSVPGLRGLRVAGLYRYRSGYPFTPGFRNGVDANGDGSARNDPAFIDENITGFSDATSGWSCVGTQAGNFAERNSCREPSLSTLDARLTIGVLGSAANRTAEIVIDGINLISSGAEQIDHALYLVNPAGALSSSPTGVVTVPLMINPDFGKPIYRSAAERTLRAGVRVRF